MIVCVCNAVSERHIRSAVKDGAASVRDLSRRTGLGTCCGKCLPEAHLVLARSLAAAEDAHESPCFAAPAADVAA